MNTKQYYQDIKPYLVRGSLKSITKRYFEYRNKVNRPITMGSAYQVIQRVLYRIQLGDNLTRGSIEIIPFFTEEAEKNKSTLEFKP